MGDARNNSESIGKKVYSMITFSIISFVLPLVFGCIWGAYEYTFWVILIIVNFMFICIMVGLFHSNQSRMKSSRNNDEWLGHRVMQLLLVIIPLFMFSIIFSFFIVVDYTTRWIIIIVVDVLLLLLFFVIYNTSRIKLGRVTKPA